MIDFCDELDRAFVKSHEVIAPSTLHDSKYAEDDVSPYEMKKSARHLIDVDKSSDPDLAPHSFLASKVDIHESSDVSATLLIKSQSEDSPFDAQDHDCQQDNRIQEIRFIHNHIDCNMEFNPQAKEFFETYGFVVFRDVLSGAECDRTASEMFRMAEEECSKFNRHDPSSWKHLKSIGKYGLSSRGPSFNTRLLENRQNPFLAAALATVLGTTIADVMVSQDRYAIYRPTQSMDGEFDASLSTGPKNVHLDLNPWWWLESSRDILDGLDTFKYNDRQDFIKENNLVVQSMGRHVQCVINILDNLESDGGTILVPRFHKQLPDWCERYSYLRKPMPWVTFPEDSTKRAAPKGLKDSLKLTEQDIHNELLQQAIRIPMRKGSVLIWDQTMMHGTAPNNSQRFRMVQYLKAFTRSKTFLAQFHFKEADGTIHSSKDARQATERSDMTSRDTKGDSSTGLSNETIESSRTLSLTADMIASPNSRLLRRSTLLMKQIETAVSDGFEVSPIGMKLFGLDVLDAHDNADLGII